MNERSGVTVDNVNQYGGCPHYAAHEQAAQENDAAQLVAAAHTGNYSTDAKHPPISKNDAPYGPVNDR